MKKRRGASPFVTTLFRIFRRLVTDELETAIVANDGVSDITGQIKTLRYDMQQVFSNPKASSIAGLDRHVSTRCHDKNRIAVTIMVKKQIHIFADAGRIFRMGPPVIPPGSALPYNLTTDDWMANNL